MIKAIVVDDEANAAEALEWQLHTYCPAIQLEKTCLNADDAIAAIRMYQPQLVFLDIEMPRKNGFEVLQAFPDPFFDVIFTTAYNQFALKAFRFAALDYLLKPVDADDLQAAVQRYEKKLQKQSIKQQLELLMQQYKQPEKLPESVTFTTSEAIHFVNPQTILYCESNSNYTTVYFADKSKMVVSKTLKEIENTLVHYHFYRIHNSYFINIRHVKRYLKADGGGVEMADGTQLPISRQRKEEFLQVLTQLSR
jgi:two-component system LytT family response regulator